MAIITGRAGDRKICIDTSKKSVHWYPRGINTGKLRLVSVYGGRAPRYEHEKLLCDACRGRRATWGILWNFTESVCDGCLAELLLNRPLREYWTLGRLASDRVRQDNLIRAMRHPYEIERCEIEWP
jgi:hypothetical protein